jgi:hypothetical protein
MLSNGFSKQFKDSGFHLCLVKDAGTLRPSENSASSLTLGITKVLVFKAAFSPPGVARQIQFREGGKLLLLHVPPSGSSFEAVTRWPPEHGLLPMRTKVNEP